MIELFVEQSLLKINHVRNTLCFLCFYSKKNLFITTWIILHQIFVASRSTWRPIRLHFVTMRLPECRTSQVWWCSSFWIVVVRKELEEKIGSADSVHFINHYYYLLSLLFFFTLYSKGIPQVGYSVGACPVSLFVSGVIISEHSAEIIVATVEIQRVCTKFN